MVKTLNVGTLHYELDIKRKITLVLGDSGDGKTTFIRTVGQQARLNPESVKRAFGNPLILSADIPEDMAMMSLAQWQQYDICLLDCDSHRIDNYAGLINKAAIPFILLSRDKVSCVPVHYDSVVRLIKNANGAMRFEAQYHPKLGLLTDIYTVIEDSGIGFRFYEQVYRRNDCVFVSAEGYGNIASRVNKAIEAYGRVQLIADGATFGNCCMDISDLNSVTCFLPESFEEVVAKSAMFNRFNSAKVAPLDTVVLQYPSMERYYEKRVADITSNGAHVKYVKNDAQVERCIRGNCAGCSKVPTQLAGSGNCRLFSLYAKDRMLQEVIHNNMRFSSSDGCVLVNQSGGIERLTLTATQEKLSKAIKSEVSALVGKVPEKQIWTESGKLVAVKLAGRWHNLINV